MSRPVTPPMDRILARITVDEETGCWVYPSLNWAGYGRIWTGPGPRRQVTHRVAYEAVKGPIPPGLDLDHLCRNRACCNPDHLEPVTRAENVDRGEGRRRTHCPAGHPYSPENTFLHHGKPACRECNRIRARRGRTA